MNLKNAAKSLIAPAVVAAGFVAIVPIVKEWRPLHPAEAEDWLPFVALVALAIEAALVFGWERAPRIALGVCALAVAGLGVFAFFRLLPQESRPSAAFQTLAAVSAFAFWLNAAALDSAGGSMIVRPMLGVVALGMAGSLLISGSAIQGELGLGFAVALILGLIVESFVSRTTDRPCRLILLASALLAAEALGGVTYSSLPQAVVLVLGVAAIAAWPAAIGPLARAATWKRAVLVALASGLIALAAVGLAYRLSPPLEF